ncbi:MAG: helix-turn-helix transcriptional regulator [Clostridia bacterium]|nr:helix-turn-helix transcriptional regulator [Clostridia bacterium]
MKSLNYTYEPHILPDARTPYLYHDKIKVTGSKMIPNWHRNVEFLRFFSGEGRVICDGESFTVGEGDIFVANSNCMHAIHSDTGVVYQCLIIDADFCQENGVDTDKIAFTPYIHDEALVRKYDSIVHEIHTESDFRVTAIRSSVLNFLLYLSRNYLDKNTLFDKHIRKSTAESIKIATLYIKSHLTEKLTLDDIAMQTGLSKFHFAREFKKNVGMTTVNYINILRCAKARKMLSSGSYRVYEVQDECGFENASYFTKVFKHFCGVTPAEFLKSIVD